MNYAGVTIDFYDDKGATVKAKFPTLDSLPEVIKTANIRPRDDLVNEDFALVAINKGHVMRKFACYDPGTTAISVVYLMEHGAKLPPDAVKTAAVHLCERCAEFDLAPPDTLVKEAGFWDFLTGAGEKRERQIKEALDYARKQRAKGVKGYYMTPDTLVKEAAMFGDVKHWFKRTFSGKPKVPASPLYEPSPTEKAVKDELYGTKNAVKLYNVWQSVHNKIDDDDRSSLNPLTEAHKAVLGHPITKRLERKHNVKFTGLRPGSTEGVWKFDLMKTSDVNKTNVVDITGQRPTPIIKEARPTSDQDYCVVLPDGQRLYPIDSYDRVKMAEVYYLDNQRGMDSVIRRQYAVKLAAKAELIGYPVDGGIKEAGALTWAPAGYVKASLEMRKVACVETEQRVLLDELFEKRADIGPDVFAEVLHQFDHQNGLSSLWGRAVPDPWSSTFGIQKTADEVIWEDGINRVTRGELENLVVNRLALVRQQFSNRVATGLKADMVAVFKSLPLPHKKILARLAADAASDGGSEIDSEAPKAGEHKEQAA